ncbi:luciferase domain-containing protein, partial [Sphingomonas bacterium]|uniref:luciferase domain-containing protein n=1 Tax=Sphingomonas bacterium TaxID=1895847 RepID=UPI001C2D16C9
PHRQLTDHAPEAVRASLTRAFDARVARDPARLGYALSHFERHNQAVTLRPGCRRCADARRTHGEIGHIHPSDGSMHMVLGASDTRAVIERGWGERHGLAGIALGLPMTYTLIYAPRDEAEVDTVATILDAAIAHMSGAARDGPDRD